ncbi:MAG TPA: PilZ domain-containing protein [Chloroflexota bacterium]|nr:PilZ domain-containing protein [Chloroflexota bacterium]
MVNWEEQRRAPRTIVDVEARLQLDRQPACQGIIQDLSFLGSLFVPELPVQVQPDSAGQLTFALPTAVSWLQPRIAVRRITSYTRPGGSQAQGIAFEFSGLSTEEERAIAAGCLEWTDHRVRTYPLAARCFVEANAPTGHFSRYGRLTSGSRGQLRLSVPTAVSLAADDPVHLKLSTTAVTGNLQTSTPERDGTELLIRVEGWGRDFFLHEARRQSMTAPELPAS